MQQGTGSLGLYAKDGRVNADLPREFSGEQIGRVRLVRFESNGRQALLEVKRDPAGRNKGNTKVTGIHRYDFWDKRRRNHPDPFGMTPASFHYDEEQGTLIWKVQKTDEPEHPDHTDQVDLAEDTEEAEQASELISEAPDA